jgi:hypothetical protein
MTPAIRLPGSNAPRALHLQVCPASSHSIHEKCADHCAYQENNTKDIQPRTPSYASLNRENVPSCRCGRYDWCRRKLLNLADQEALLVYELLVLCAVVQERRQEAEQLVPIANQDPLHRD